MTPKRFPSDLLEQAVDIQDAWGRIDEQMTVGNISAASLTALINQIRMLECTIAGVQNQLLEVRAQREVLCQSLWDQLKRARSFVKGLYGDDSVQYELVGGKRLSDRKPRRTAAPAEKQLDGLENQVISLQDKD